MRTGLVCLCTFGGTACDQAVKTPNRSTAAGAYGGSGRTGSSASRIERHVGDDIHHQDELQVGSRRVIERRDQCLSDPLIGEVLVLEVDVVGGVLDRAQVGLEDAQLTVVEPGQGVHVDGPHQLRAGQELASRSAAVAIAAGAGSRGAT